MYTSDCHIDKHTFRLQIIGALPKVSPGLIQRSLKISYVVRTNTYY